jgi:hypothetical protein
VDVIPTGNRLDLRKARMLEEAGEHDVSEEAITSQAYGGEAHSDLKGDTCLFRYDAYRTATPHQPREIAKESDGQWRLSGEMVPQSVLRAKV